MHNYISLVHEQLEHIGYTTFFMPKPAFALVFYDLMRDVHLGMDTIKM